MDKGLCSGKTVAASAFKVRLSSDHLGDCASLVIWYRDFIGMARQEFEESLPTRPAAIHFTGAAGNVAVGKYSKCAAMLKCM